MAWSKSNTSICNNSFTGFAHLFAILKGVLLDPSFSAGPQGGERIESVLNQPEEKEFLTLKPGYFQIRCDNNTEDMKYKFQHGDHLVKWMAALKLVSKMPEHQEVDKITMAVTRYEYANVYHTMTDWYNAFLMLLFFNVKSFTANILFIDSHPQGGLDSIWTTLFGGYGHAGQLTKPQYFKTLIWNIQGTDILVGMHGAGLTLALFLPKHAGLIELYPKYWSVDNVHFKAIARWRNLQYTQWQNMDNKMEFPDYFTYIAPSVIQNLLSNIIGLMCKPNKDKER
uniref:Beta-(1,2)-xylosyltransferase n=1 Tax=Magallana gigas TaxID=29159 RepID=K1PUM1_MAGGI